MGVMVNRVTYGKIGGERAYRVQVAWNCLLINATLCFSCCAVTLVECIGLVAYFIVLILGLARTPPP